MSNADLIARLLEAAPVENGQIVLSYDSLGEHIVLDALLREAAAALAEYDLRKFDVGMRDREIARLTSELKERDAMCERAREIMAAVLGANEDAMQQGASDNLMRRRLKYGLIDCIDNHGHTYQSESLAEALRRASSVHADLGKMETK